MSQAASQRRVGTNLTTGPIMKSLLLFAFPIVLTNLVQQLYSMVDLIVIGQYVGSVGTVGVNTGGDGRPGQPCCHGLCHRRADFYCTAGGCGR